MAWVKDNNSLALLAVEAYTERSESSSNHTFSKEADQSLKRSWARSIEETSWLSHDGSKRNSFFTGLIRSTTNAANNIQRKSKTLPHTQRARKRSTKGPTMAVNIP